MICDITLDTGAASPDLLPVGYLVGDVNNISISLRGMSSICLVFLKKILCFTHYSERCILQ